MKRFLLSTVLACAFAAPAYAVPVTWNFGDHPGALGVTQLFTGSDGATINVEGFAAGDIGAKLFSKTDGGDESGIGLQNDPSTNDEITGGNFVLINLDGTRDKKVSDFTFSMNSTTDGEGWDVYGSLDSSPFSFTHLLTGFDEGSHSLANGFDNYAFFYNNTMCGEGCGNQNVLVASLGGVAAGVPEARTWVMMLTGFALIGYTALRRRGGMRLVSR
jgi:hypothetical protein